MAFYTGAYANLRLYPSLWLQTRYRKNNVFAVVVLSQFSRFNAFDMTDCEYLN